VPHICGTGDVDWGVDSLTYALYFHWSLTHDRGVRTIMNALDRTAVSYSPAVGTSSDVPVWDAVADVREYQVARDVEAVAKAEAAFRFVADGRSRFALGACPAVDYQLPGGGAGKLKTLETGSNYTKAALLLYQVTRFPGYLRDAEKEYAAARRYFLSPGAPLYTVYVFDNGSACTYDRTGIWQDKSSSGRSLPDSVLFAWRWPTPGRHTIQIRPGVPNAKEGGSFFHMTGYEVMR
jgi:hypothetical protein